LNGDDRDDKNGKKESDDAFGDETRHRLADKRETRRGGVGGNGRFTLVANAAIECYDQK
jgi:hypothetical protein